jgi:hypothetical protein
MKNAQAQRVSTMNDNKTWCRPVGYDEGLELEVDLDDYQEVASGVGELPECDFSWPKAAPNYVKVGDKILERKPVEHDAATQPSGEKSPTSKGHL